MSLAFIAFSHAASTQAAPVSAACRERDKTRPASNAAARERERILTSTENGSAVSVAEDTLSKYDHHRTLDAAIQIGHEVQNIISFVSPAQAKGIAAPDWLLRLPHGDWLTQQWNAWIGSGDATREPVHHFSSGSTLGWTRRLGSHVFHSFVVMGFTLLTLFFLYLHGEALTISRSEEHTSE